MSDSFFELITRYSQRPSHDPGENRLTAVLTAVLQVRRSLARALMNSLVANLALEVNPTVETQTTTPLSDGRHGFIDIEIVAPPPRATTIWIEVKRTSGESGQDQFDKYRRALEGKQGRRAMLVLAPSRMRAALGELPAAHEWDPATVVRPHWVSWEEIYSTLETLLAESTDGWETWAIAELLGYLETEGFRPVPLTPQHLNAIANIAEATKAVNLLVASIEQTLQPDFGTPDKRNDAIRDGYYERRYLAAVVNPRGDWSSATSFAWGITQTELFAGVCTPADRGQSDSRDPSAIESWRASFDPHVWTHQDGSEEYWIWQELKLSDIAQADESAQQSELAVAFLRTVLNEVANH